MTGCSCSSSTRRSAATSRKTAGSRCTPTRTRRRRTSSRSGAGRGSSRQVSSRAGRGGLVLRGRRHVLAVRAATPVGDPRRARRRRVAAALPALVRLGLALSAAQGPAGREPRPRLGPVKKIGFLSFGHWSASPHSQVRSGRTRSSSRSSWPRRSRTSAPTARTSASITSPSSSHRRSRCSPRSGHGRSGSRSGRRSSTCATRTRCTWPRTPARPISSPAAGCSSGSAAARRSR